MEIDPNDYIFEHPLSQCALCLSSTTWDYWILGDAFLKGWYSTHDMDAQQFGFVPHINSNKNPAVAGTVPTTPYTEYNGEL